MKKKGMTVKMILKADNIKTVRIGGRELRINQKIIPDTARADKDVASYVKKGDKVKPCLPIGKGGIPLGVTVHNTAEISTPPETDMAEQYARATYPNLNMGGAMVHFYVWHDSIWQLLRENEQGWHAADGTSRRLNRRGDGMIGGNLDTVAIECIGPDAESEDTAAHLTAYILREFGLSAKYDVYPHNYFYAKKYCPVYILPHWDSFIEKVELIASAADKKTDYENHWAKEYIEKCIEKGLMLGYSDGSFRPDANITRAELAVILTRLTEKEES